MSQRLGKDAPEQLLPADALLDAFRRSGRPEDFERIIRRFSPLVLAECRRVTRDPHDAVDAAQLAFLVLAIELKSGTPIRHPAAWLQRVAKRQALKIIRSRGRRRRREDDARRTEHATPEPVRLEVADRDRHAGLVRDAIDALSERYRLPIVLHYFGGLSLASIAIELRITRQAVGTRLHRGRKMLAESLAARGVTIDDATLGALAATLVPAAVVAALLRSLGTATVRAAPDATLANGIAALLHATTATAGRRTIAAAAAVLGVTGTSFAWVAPPGWLRELPARIGVLLSPPDGIEPTPLRFVPPIAVPSFSATTTMTAQPTVGVAPRPLASPSSTAERVASTSVPTRSAVVSSMTDRAPRPSGGPPRTDFDVARIGPPAVLASPRVAGRNGLPTLRPGATSIDRDETLPRGGVVEFAGLIVGDAGAGRFDLAGGVLRVDGLTIGARPGSRGEVHVGDGDLQVTGDDAPLVVGGLGRGRLLLGTQDAPGRLTTLGAGADASLIVRATRQSRGLIQGWGDVRIGGTLVNNGWIVADGFEHLRALSFGEARAVTNTIDNPRDGLSGWFARRGGRVVLPTIDVAAGTHAYTWGEDAADPTLDLVNSLRFVAHDQPTATRATISLRTIAGADPLDVPLPTGVAIFGLWQIDSPGLKPTSLDVTTRYDQTSANSIWPGESAVRLLGHVDGRWVEASDQSVNLSARLVTGTFAGGVDLLAVGIFWEDPFRAGLARTFSSQSLVGASIVVPEPTSLVGVVAIAVLARRRRRVTNASRSL